MSKLKMVQINTLKTSIPGTEIKSIGHQNFLHALGNIHNFISSSEIIIPDKY